MKVRHSDAVINMIRDGRCEKVIEIGIWKSDTTKRVLKACSDVVTEYWAVDEWKVMCDGHGKQSNRSPEHWEEMYYYACRLMRWYPQLKVLRMGSVVAANIFPDDYFDALFLDANHYYRYVMADIKAWFLGIIGGVLKGRWMRYLDHLVSKHLTNMFGW
jgi:hypothetical protein